MDVLHLGVFIHRGLDSKCHSLENMICAAVLNQPLI